MRFWPRKPKEGTREPAPASPQTSDFISLSQRLNPRQILYFKDPAPLRDVYAQLISTWGNVDRARVLEAVLEREKISPTVIDQQIALPHARLLEFGPLRAALGLCPKGLDGPDGTIRLRIVLLFAGDLSQPRESLAFLSAAATLFAKDGLPDRLLQESNPLALLELLKVVETRDASE